MNEIALIPFSARYSPQNKQIDNVFPDTARMGLIHLLFDLVERDYVEGWGSTAKELQRISRRPPSSLTTDQAKRLVTEILAELNWLKIYDFCERLYGHLAKEIGFNGQFEYEITVPKDVVQKYISLELTRLFLEEGLAYEFSNGLVRRRGRKHSVEVAAKAHLVLGDLALSGARRHYEKSLSFFRSPSNPDYENCVKEAVCSVEAAAKALFPKSKSSTLGDFSKWLTSTQTVEVPKALSQTITSIYAFRSGGEGIGHGGATGGKATKEVAEYILSVCASQIIYLVDLANQSSDEIPF